MSGVPAKPSRSLKTTLMILAGAGVLESCSKTSQMMLTEPSSKTSCPAIVPVDAFALVTTTRKSFKEPSVAATVSNVAEVFSVKPTTIARTSYVWTPLPSPGSYVAASAQVANVPGVPTMPFVKWPVTGSDTAPSSMPDKIPEN